MSVVQRGPNVCLNKMKERMTNLGYNLCQALVTKVT